VFPAARRALAAGLVILPLALPLAACGGTASSTTASSPAGAATSSAGSPASSAPATGGGEPSATPDTATGSGTGIAISVKGNTVTPSPGTIDVKAGEEVTLEITSDRTSEVHVHVVDLEKKITAGTPLTITFTPTQTGVYEVELHDPDLLLTKIAVR
jgi:plastocyanin